MARTRLVRAGPCTAAASSSAPPLYLHAYAGRIMLPLGTLTHSPNPRPVKWVGMDTKYCQARLVARCKNFEKSFFYI